jgi:hypothetical protein
VVHMVPRQSLTTLPKYDEMVNKQNKAVVEHPATHTQWRSDHRIQTLVKLFQMGAATNTALPVSASHLQWLGCWCSRRQQSD